MPSTGDSDSVTDRSSSSRSESIQSDGRGRGGLRLGRTRPPARRRRAPRGHRSVDCSMLIVIMPVTGQAADDFFTLETRAQLDSHFTANHRANHRITVIASAGCTIRPYRSTAYGVPSIQCLQMRLKRKVWRHHKHYLYNQLRQLASEGSVITNTVRRATYGTELSLQSE